MPSSDLASSISACSNRAANNVRDMTDLTSTNAPSRATITGPSRPKRIICLPAGAVTAGNDQPVRAFPTVGPVGFEPTTYGFNQAVRSRPAHWLVVSIYLRSLAGRLLSRVEQSGPFRPIRLTES